jgi:hypothetical protein
VASTCSSPPALASACLGSGGGRSGSVMSALGAGSLGVGSSEAGGSGIGVASAGFGLRLMSLADLIKQESVMLLHNSRRIGCLLCQKKEMYTYSEDFFMTAFFTLRARGVSTMVLVAGGGVTPAGGMVPAMAMVTAPVAEADGSIPTSSR